MARPATADGPGPSSMAGNHSLPASLPPSLPVQLDVVIKCRATISFSLFVNANQATPNQPIVPSAVWQVPPS